MKLQCFGVDDGCLLKPLAEDKPNAAWMQDDDFRWLDIEGAEPGELLQILAPFNLHDDVFALLATETPSPRYVVIGQARCGFVPLPVREGESTQYLTLVCLPTTLITIHTQHLESLQELLTAATMNHPLPAVSVGGVIFEILDRFIAADVLTFFNVRRGLDELAASLDGAPQEVEMEAIMAMSRVADQLMTNCEDQVYVHAIFLGQQALNREKLQSNVQIAFDGLERFRVSLARMENRLRDFNQQYQRTLQEITNNRLRLLTILSAVFLPLTLISGVYGMNFENMPELDEPYAHFFTLSGMVIIGAGMFAYFYFKGWLK